MVGAIPDRNELDVRLHDFAESLLQEGVASPWRRSRGGLCPHRDPDVTIWTSSWGEPAQRLLSIEAALRARRRPAAQRWLRPVGS
jgi:hypothetical protein